MATTNLNPINWLDLQDESRYRWSQFPSKKSSTASRLWYRPMGVVESLFDGDGIYFEGRADLHHNTVLEANTTLDAESLRERIVLVWTVIRHAHVLLSCRTDHLVNNVSGQMHRRWTDKCFVYDWPKNAESAIAATRPHIRFVDEFYPDLDRRQFYTHLVNTARPIDPSKTLSTIFVMPVRPDENGRVTIQLMTVMAHQIADGLTVFNRLNHIAELLNFSEAELMAELDYLLIDEQALFTRLPVAQEALYPRRSQNPARARWRWAITRILRHVRTPAPAAFQNPCLRTQPLKQAQKPPPIYAKVLDYSKVPPLNGGHTEALLNPRAALNLRSLCKEAKISVGSGLFALVAMSMMALEEERNPEISLDKRLPFVGSFPVNSRPFLTTPSSPGKEDSCVLAFSDGVVLPFLSTDLDLSGRFRLLGKLAHRQLKQYQKKKRTLEEELTLGSRSPSQLLPALFCSTVERMEGRAEGEHKANINVQGGYPARVSPTLATCGISSVGEVSTLLPTGRFNIEEMGDRDLAADFRKLDGGVRPRDGEFLIGAFGRGNQFEFLLMYDGNAMDPTKVSRWSDFLRSLLDVDLPRHKASRAETSKARL